MFLMNNPGMPINAKFKAADLITTLLVALLCFVVTYFVFGFYYVEYEGLNTGFLSSKLTPKFPMRALYFSGNMGISYFYSFFYEHLPNVEWLSWFYYSYLFLSCFIGLYLVAILLPTQTPVILKIILQVLVYYLVFADHHIHYIYTRVSYMTCGLSLIAIVVFFNSVSVIKLRWWLFMLLNLFFTIGALTRFEAATASLLLLVTFAGFYLQNIWQTVLLFLYPAFLIGAMTLLLSIDIKTATEKEFYKQVEPDIEEQFIARENRVPLSFMKTHRDTVMYKTAAEMMWSDPQIISAAYLRSLILPEKFMFTDGKQWNRVYRKFLEVITQYWYLILLTILLSVAVFIQHGFRKLFSHWLYLLTFLFSFWALITVQGYTDKVNERSFLPFLSLFIFCHVVLLVRGLSIRFSVWLYPLLISCFVLFWFHIYCLKEESTILKTDWLKYQVNFEKIKQAATKKYLVLNSTSFDYLLLSNIPFHPFDFSAFKKIYITDGYIIPFLPYYKRYLEHDCKCDIYAFPSFWNYLKSIRQDVVIVSTPNRMEVLKEYLEEIHQFSLPIVEEKSVQLREQRKSDNRNNPDEMKMYVFGKRIKDSIY
jgi:hypothetical protein